MTLFSIEFVRPVRLVPRLRSISIEETIDIDIRRNFFLLIAIVGVCDVTGMDGACRVLYLAKYVAKDGTLLRASPEVFNSVARNSACKYAGQQLRSK